MGFESFNVMLCRQDGQFVSLGGTNPYDDLLQALPDLVPESHEEGSAGSCSNELHFVCREEAYAYEIEVFVEDEQFKSISLRFALCCSLQVNEAFYDAVRTLMTRYRLVCYLGTSSPALSKDRLYSVNELSLLKRDMFAAIKYEKHLWHEQAGDWEDALTPPEAVKRFLREGKAP